VMGEIVFNIVPTQRLLDGEKIAGSIVIAQEMLAHCIDLCIANRTKFLVFSTLREAIIIIKERSNEADCSDSFLIA
jgi:hypothetical protein